MTSLPLPLSVILLLIFQTSSQPIDQSDASQIIPPVDISQINRLIGIVWYSNISFICENIAFTYRIGTRNIDE